MSKILFRSPYKTTGSGQPPRSVYGENMPRTLLRRHDKYQARAGVLVRRRRRELLTAIIVIIIILGGDIAARRPWHKADHPYRPAIGTTR
jgi:hypothetical protein